MKWESFFNQHRADDTDVINGLVDVKCSGRYTCRVCKKKKFEYSKDSWVKCLSCGHEESATANTLFDGMRMPLSKAFNILIAFQEQYDEAYESAYQIHLDKNQDEEGEYLIDSYIYHFHPKEGIDTRLSVQEIADAFSIQKNSVMAYLKRIADWMPKKYKAKPTAMLPEWTEGLKTKESETTYYALYHLLFDDSYSGVPREWDTMFNLMVLKKPFSINEDDESWHEWEDKMQEEYYYYLNFENPLVYGDFSEEVREANRKKILKNRYGDKYPERRRKKKE